jgi:hypothetical protein
LAARDATVRDVWFQSMNVKWIAFLIWIVASNVNLIYVIVIGVRAADSNYVAINQWDLIYHAYTLGA